MNATFLQSVFRKAVMRNSSNPSVIQALLFCPATEFLLPVHLMFESITLTFIFQVKVGKCLERMMSIIAFSFH